MPERNNAQADAIT